MWAITTRCNCRCYFCKVWRKKVIEPSLKQALQTIDTLNSLGCYSLSITGGEPLLYPYIERPDVFVVMSSEGYDKYAGELKDGGMLLYEKDLVHPTAVEGRRDYGVPSTRIAESLGRALIQNIVMLGFFAAATRLVSQQAMRDAVAGSVPAGTEELNLKAFDAGWDYFEREYGEHAQGKEEAAVPAGTAAGA